MDLDLRNKVALVTGGSRGLGRAVCLGLAGEGVRVMINYRRDEQRRADLAQLIRGQHGVDAAWVAGDVSSSADVTRMFDQCERELGPLDILVNNAGVWPTAYVKDLTEEAWDRTLAVNLKGAFLTCREAVRRWLRANARWSHCERQFAGGVHRFHHRTCRLRGLQGGVGQSHRLAGPRSRRARDLMSTPWRRE